MSGPDELSVTTDRAHSDINTSDIRNSLPQVHVDENPHGCDVVDTRIKRTVGDKGHRYIYRMDKPRRGIFVIINNVTFDTGMGERSGSDRDAAALKLRFGTLGFDVEEHRDLGRQDMIKLLREVGGRDHGDADCFGCAILSHGDEDGVYATDSVKPVRLTLLTDPLKGDRCPTLAGKPKLMFIQACRGEDYDDGIDGTDAAAQEHRRSRLPLEADFIYAYSTTPGYFSWRHGGEGSWFVQALTEVLEAYGAEKEVVWILTRVNNIVAYEFESSARNSSMNQKKQIPSIVSMLTKELYFSEK